MNQDVVHADPRNYCGGKFEERKINTHAVPIKDLGDITFKGPSRKCSGCGEFLVGEEDMETADAFDEACAKREKELGL